MTMRPAAGEVVPPSRDDLRRLEAGVNARFDEANARLVLLDGRFAAAGDRIRQAERRTDTSAARIDSRLRTVDRQLADIDRHLHAVRTSTSECRDRTGDLLREYRAATIRLIVVGVAVTVVANAALTGGLFLTFGG